MANNKKKEETQEKILDVDASMQGTIAFKDPVNLRINGSFEGKLDTRGNLTIGENAKVTANIHGDNIVIAGKVSGDVIATRSLSILGTATLKGNLTAPRLSVGEGAILGGPDHSRLLAGGDFAFGQVAVALVGVGTVQYLFQNGIPPVANVRRAN